MPEPPEPPISITLSPAQVDHILRAASHSTSPGIAALVSGGLRRRAARGGPGSHDGDRAPVPGRAARPDARLSRSLLRGLSILGCFDTSGEERGIVELSREAGMSASTAHRYALTLIELGLLERSPRSRRYRLPADPSP
jgi:IclR helix-turn-helix domain